MQTLFVPREIKYTGKQLRAHWAYESFNLEGDSIVAFVGLCEIHSDWMVDLADRRQGARIYSPSMLHFIVEHFDLDLEKALLRQRLLVCILQEELNRRLKANVVERQGDDLFDGDHKLSVSVATLTPVSSVIHLGINTSGERVPVPAKGLKDYGLDPKELAEAVMERYQRELEDLKLARCRVKGVK